VRGSSFDRDRNVLINNVCIICTNCRPKTGESHQNQPNKLPSSVARIHLPYKLKPDLVEKQLFEFVVEPKQTCEIYTSPQDRRRKSLPDASLCGRSITEWNQMLSLMGVRDPSPSGATSQNVKQIVDHKLFAELYVKTFPKEKSFQYWEIEGCLNAESAIKLCDVLLAMAVHKGGNIQILPIFDDEIILGWQSFAIDPEKSGENQVFCIFGDYELIQEEFSAMGFSKSNPMAINMAQDWKTKFIRGPNITTQSPKEWLAVGLFVPKSRALITGNFDINSTIKELSIKIQHVVKTENLKVEFYLGFDTGYAGKNGLSFEQNFFQNYKKYRGQKCENHLFNTFSYSPCPIPCVCTPCCNNRTGTKKELDAMKFRNRNNRKTKSEGVSKTFKSKSRETGYQSYSSMITPTKQIVLYVANDPRDDHDQKALADLLDNPGIEEVIIPVGTISTSEYPQHFVLKKGHTNMEMAIQAQELRSHTQACALLRFATSPTAVSKDNITIMAEQMVVLTPAFGAQPNYSKLIERIVEGGGMMFSPGGEEYKQTAENIDFESMTEAGDLHKGAEIKREEMNAYLEAAQNLNQLPGNCYGNFAGSRCHVNSAVYHSTVLILANTRSAGIAKRLAKGMRSSFSQVAILSDFTAKEPLKSYKQMQFVDREIFNKVLRRAQEDTTFSSNVFVGCLKDAVLRAVNAAKAKGAEAPIDPEDTATILVPRLYRPNVMAAKLVKEKQRAAEAKSATATDSPGFSKFLPTAKSGKLGGQGRNQKVRKSGAFKRKEKMAEEARKSKQLAKLVESMVDDVTPDNMSELEKEEFALHYESVTRAHDELKQKKRSAQIRKFAEERFKRAQALLDQQELESREDAARAAAAQDQEHEESQDEDMESHEVQEVEDSPPPPPPPPPKTQEDEEDDDLLNHSFDGTSDGAEEGELTPKTPPPASRKGAGKVEPTVTTLTSVTVPVKQHISNNSAVLFLLQPAPPYVNAYPPVDVEDEQTGSQPATARALAFTTSTAASPRKGAVKKPVNTTPSRLQGRNSRSRTARELLSLRQYTTYVWFSSPMKCLTVSNDVNAVCHIVCHRGYEGK
jgi:hypothetical protein